MLVFLAFTSITTLLLISLSSGGALKSINVFGGVAHAWCLQRVPASTHAHLYSSLICGEPLPHSVLKSDLRALALLHLVTTSGLHIAVLIQGLRWLADRWVTNPRGVLSLRSFLITTFLILTSFRIALVRLAISHALRAANRRLALQLTDLQLVTATGFATLAFCRTRIDLLALLIGWLAALAFSFWRIDEDHERSWLKKVSLQLLCYVILLPALLSLGVPNLTSVVWSVLFTGFVSFAVFPSSLLAFTFPRFALPLADRVCGLFTWCVHELAGRMPSGFAKLDVDGVWIWAYLCALTLTGLVFDSFRRLAIRAELDEI